MLSNHIWPLRALVPLELKQCAMEGRDTAPFLKRAEALAGPGLADEERERLAAELFAALADAPVRPDYPYEEPVELKDILAARPAGGGGVASELPDLADGRLYDGVYGAWLGRCAGCLLGQPVEFWPRARLEGLLGDTDNYPAERYISSELPEELRAKYGVTDRGWNYGSDVVNWVNNVRRMPEDDDINYTILALKLLEQSGPGFAPEDVALRWLMDLPALHTFTAERIAYRNFLNGVFPPRSAAFRNPCREGLGAQIRGDFFGLIHPGRPEAAAAMAHRDASISHTKNGVYGEMWVAAMLSAVAAGLDAGEILRCGLAQIPARCRLSEGVGQVHEWHGEGLAWQDAVGRIHAQFDEKDPIESLYVVPNAMVVSAGLLYGEMDFTKSLGIALAGSFDKDCNCATVGSIVGRAIGASALPKLWTAPLNDEVKSGIDGFGVVRISELAERTVKVVETVGEGHR